MNKIPKLKFQSKGNVGFKSLGRLRTKYQGLYLFVAESEARTGKKNIPRGHKQHQKQDLDLIKTDQGQTVVGATLMGITLVAFHEVSII